MSVMSIATPSRSACTLRHPRAHHRDGERGQELPILNGGHIPLPSQVCDYAATLRTRVGSGDWRALNRYFGNRFSFTRFPGEDGCVVIRLSNGAMIIGMTPSALEDEGSYIDGIGVALLATPENGYTLPVAAREAQLVLDSWYAVRPLTYAFYSGWTGEPSYEFTPEEAHKSGIYDRDSCRTRGYNGIRQYLQFAHSWEKIDLPMRSDGLPASYETEPDGHSWFCIAPDTTDEEMAYQYGLVRYRHQCEDPEALARAYTDGWMGREYHSACG